MQALPPAGSRIHLPPLQRAAIEAHGAGAYPEECCGVLIGRPLAAGAGIAVAEALPAANAGEGRWRDRYVLPPQAVMAALQRARSRGLEVVGFYHSHPDHPAEPSEVDRAEAWPHVAYLILAVQGGRPAGLRSWRLREDRKGFDEAVVEGVVEGDIERPPEEIAAGSAARGRGEVKR